MKTTISILLLAFGLLILSGCATARPNAIAGKYYMMGDSNCARYRVISDSRIMCFTSDGVQVGYRDAMSNQELSMYQFRQAQDDAAWSQLNYNTQQQANRNAYQLKQMGY